MGVIGVVAASCQRVEDRVSWVAPLVWGGEQKLLASDAAELDHFGWSVSLANDRALVGAHGESDGRGAAYVFVKSGDIWIEEQKLVASDGAELDRFGSSVSLGTDRILVGAYGADAFRGAAYVFVKSGASWTEEQRIVASDGAAGENFGYSVSLAGERALVGAFGSGAARGAAYVFVRGGSVWTEEQKLVASDGAADDTFGWSISVAGDRALVGAPGHDGARGAAYVFVRNGSAWAEEQELVANDGVGFDNFGNAVSLAGDRALVGAYWNDDFRGAAYVFVRSDSSWTAEQKLVASDGAGSRFGTSVSLAADRALIGAVGNGSGRGAAYAFLRNGSWTEEQRLVADDGQADLFAWSVSLAADRAVVGAIYNDQLRGAAYLFSQGVEDRDAGSADADVADGVSIEAGAPQPGSCTRGDECATGSCEDGICCDRTCAASERCRADLKVSGEDGVCGPASAAAPGAPCKFDVQCTSGHCAGAGADGVCANPPRTYAASDDAGCGCRAGSPPTRDPAAWFGLALVLLLLMCSSRRHIALALIAAGIGFGSCGGNQTPSHGGRDGSAGGAGGGPMASDSPLLPARARRLTNAEYAASVFVLLGVDAEASVGGFPRDATQTLGFTVNDAQVVSSVLAAELDSTAESTVAAARQTGQLAGLAPCSDSASEGETCARAFIQSFGARAYRRPLTAEDIDPLLALYRAAIGEGVTYDEGIDFVTRAILQAPGFIYLTELGDSTAGSPAGTTTLTSHEIASLLSYMATAAPPDRTLLDNLDALATADGREQQLRRLLPSFAARARLVRVVREWLGIDGVAEIDKDSNVYPSFAASHNAMVAESRSFIDEVLNNGAGTLQELLGAEWTIIATEYGATEEEIGWYYTGTYGLGSGGTTRTLLTGASGGARVGILNQGAFLSRFATATGSNPIMRGVAVIRRVACLELPDPIELDISVIPPVPDPNNPKTTRELFAAHAADPVCRTCHQSIDNFGFAFEQYDGVGAFRAVDTAVTLAGTSTDLDGDYADSNALARALAGSAAVRACMARQMFRASTGRGDASARGAEDNFVTQWRQLSVDQQSNLIETLVAFVRSDIFVERSTGR